MQKHKTLIRVIAVVLSLLMIATVAPIAASAVERTEHSLTIASQARTALAPGVTETSVVSYDKNGKRVQYFVVDCDVNNGTTEVKANYHDNDNTGVWGKATVVEQANAAKQKRGYNVVASTNASYYNVNTGQPTGAFVMEGVNINGTATGNSYQFFAQLDDGSYVIGDKNEFGNYADHVVEAVGGHLMLVKDGAVVAGLNSTDKYPRSTVGLKADGSVVLMLADGNNQPYSIGLTYAEQAQLMLELGCVDAIELDGGGSATYAAKPEGSDEIEVRNVCCDGTVRSVSNTLMVITTAISDGQFDHANLSTEYAYQTPNSNVEITATGADAAGGNAKIPDGVTWTLTEPATQLSDDAVTDGYYLVGDFSDWKPNAAFKFAENPATEGEYMLDATFANNTEFKAVQVSGDNTTWIPEGSNNNIQLDAGAKTIYFRPEVTTNDGWIGEGQHFYVQDKPSFGTIENGVFHSTGRTGTVTANMEYNGAVVGSIDLTVVNPTSFAFSAAEKTVPYGKTADFSITAMYNGAEVYAPASSYNFAVTAGSMDGFTYAAPTDETVTSGTVTATYKYDANLPAATVTVTYGKGSEVLFDFEDGDVSNWLSWDGMEQAIADGKYTGGYTMPYNGVETNWSTTASNNVAAGIKESTFLATKDNGKVHSGNYALGYTFDYTQGASFQNWMYGYLYYTGDTKVFRDTANGIAGTRLGMWMYIPEEAVGSCSRLSYTYKTADGAVSTAYLYFTYQYVKKGFSKLTSDKIPEAGWAYVYCDLDDISTSYVTTSYYKNEDGSLTRAEASNYAPAFIQWIVSSSAKGAENVTFYIDDITLDYSDVVDDRDAPVISNPLALDDLGSYALNGREVNTNVLSFTADAVEDTVHNPGNATGIDPTSAKVYVDGHEVAAKYSAGKITTGYFTFPNGIHDVSFEIADKQGNVTKMTKQVTVASDATYPVVSLVGEPVGNGKVKMGGQYNLNVNTDKIEDIDKVTTTIWLNSASKWSLENAAPADGFTYDYDIDEAACKATITITRVDSNATGAATLLSIPVYAWAWDGSAGVDAHTQWTSGVPNGDGATCPAVTISYKAFLGDVEYVTGAVSAPANYVAGFSNIRQDVVTELDSAIANLKNTIGEWHYHTAEAVPDKAATCTEDGYTGRTKCSDPNCNSIIDWGTTIPAKHAYEFVDGQFVCRNCGDTVEPTFGLYTDYNGDTYYAVAGQFMTGWQMVDDDWYYFDENSFKGIDGEVAANTVVDTDADFTFTFDKGRLTSGEWAITENGRKYYYGPDFYHGRSGVANVQVIDGNTYAFGPDGYAFTETTIFLRSQWTTPVCWIFDENGVYQGVYTGVFEDYYFIDGTRVDPYYGLVEYEGDFYYVNDYAKVVKGKDCYVLTTNDLTFADGTPIAKGTYSFDADGKMIVKNGIVDGVYYENNKAVPYKGLIKDNGDFYYVDAYGEIVKGKDFYVLTTNDLTYNNGTPVAKGTYSFDADGKMAVKEGLVGDTYYENNKAVPYKGLIKVDDDFYYVDAYGKIVMGKDFYVLTTNDLTYANGNPVVKGTYTFDADGKMVVKEGLVGDTYYENNKAVPYKGLIKDNDDFYYVDAYGKIVMGKDFYVLTTNDLTYNNGTPIVKGTYTFDADGKMIVKSGIVDGVYYENNKAVPYKGLIKDNGDFYYVDADGKIVMGKDFYVLTTNDLTYNNGTPIAKGTYTFDADGKMVVKEGLVGDTYYENNKAVPYKGLIKVEGDFYYVDAYGKIVKDKNFSVLNTNGLTYDNGDPVVKGTYAFNADGKMVID